jgi:hypothetical protein
VAELDAAVMKDGLVRADTLPLVFRVPGTESLPRGSRVRVRITGIDLLTLDLHASWPQRLGRAGRRPRRRRQPPRTTTPKPPAADAGHRRGRTTPAAPACRRRAGGEPRRPRPEPCAARSPASWR